MSNQSDHTLQGGTKIEFSNALFMVQLWSKGGVRVKVFRAPEQHSTLPIQLLAKLIYKVIPNTRAFRAIS
jgi:hypothetical protein